MAVAVKHRVDVVIVVTPLMLDFEVEELLLESVDFGVVVELGLDNGVLADLRVDKWLPYPLDNARCIMVWLSRSTRRDFASRAVQTVVLSRPVVADNIFYVFVCELSFEPLISDIPVINYIVCRWRRLLDALSLVLGSLILTGLV